MIQPNEIRLNNWVQTQKGTYKQIKDICEDGSVWLRCNLCVKAKYRHELEGLHPIPLTEDVLLKCGFEKELDISKHSFIKEPDLFYRKDRIIWIGFIDNEWYFYKDSDINAWFKRNKCKGLHHVQNIIFDLTNQELEIEL